MGSVAATRAERELVDAEPSNAKVERARRDTERRRGTVRPVHATSSGAQGRLDALSLVHRFGITSRSRRAGQLEIGELEYVTVGEDDGPLHQVLQLTDVAGPGVGSESLHRARADATDPLPELRRV